MSQFKAMTILMADDDPDDQLLTRDALVEAGLQVNLHCVEDGVELLDYMHHRGSYANLPTVWPDLILLDLNMPRKDGRETLLELKNDATLRTIPVVVMTTSQAEEDILHVYQLGANSFVRKPLAFSGLVAVMRTLGTYWFSTVDLPAPRRG